MCFRARLFRHGSFIRLHAHDGLPSHLRLIREAIIASRDAGAGLDRPPLPSSTDMETIAHVYPCHRPAGARPYAPAQTGGTLSFLPDISNQPSSISGDQEPAMQQWKIFFRYTEHHPSDMYSPSTLRLMIDAQPDRHQNCVRLEVEEERVVSGLDFDFLALRALRDQFEVAVKEKNYPGATIKLPDDKLILRYNNRGDPFDEGIDILIRPNNIADDDYRFDEPHVFVDRSELSFAIKYIDDILKA